MQENRHFPIGIFDSGIGGLTVARAVKNLLPNEQLIYFGDTAHLPYGDKSKASIQNYSVKIAEVLIKSKCKLILIACNSASAAAYELVKTYAVSKAFVFNVIEPVIAHLGQFHAGKKVGLIGTRQTVNSGVYLRKVIGLDLDICLQSLATPLLVPMIEEEFHKDDLSLAIIKTYLDHPDLEGIQALVLGCTHYPLIRRQIQEFYDNRVQVIDSSEIVAASVKAFLKDHDLLNNKQTHADKFMVTDYTVSFEHATKLFFGQEVQLQKYPRWEGS